MPIWSAEEYFAIQVEEERIYPLPTDCATSNYRRLIHNEETWRRLQAVYYEEKQARHSYHHRTHNRLRNLNHLGYSGLTLGLLEVRDGERGRAIYATEDIPSGTVVWKGNDQTNNGFWPNPRSMRKFLRRLPHDLQCDVLLWAYAYSGQTRTQEVECNLDEASFFNHGERPDMVNVVNKGVRSITSRDVAKGEELLMDYSAFIALGDESVAWWDDLRQTAWSEGEGLSNRLEGNHSNSEEEDDTCMNDYVNYGKPKPDAPPVVVESSATPKASSSVFVGASAPRTHRITRAAPQTFAPVAATKGLPAEFVLALAVAGGVWAMGKRQR